jgi:hypothetical protein
MSADLARSNALADLAARIKIEHEAAAGALKRTLTHAMAAGDLLLEAKAQLKHGEWLPWLEARCGIPERTARLYMRLARNREELSKRQNGNVADLTVRGALAVLSAAPDSFAVKAADSEVECLELAAYELAELERKRRRAAFEATDSALTEICKLCEANPQLVPLAEAVFDEVGALLLSAIDDCKSALVTALDAEPFDPAIKATDAILKAQGLASSMLRRVAEAAA